MRLHWKHYAIALAATSLSLIAHSRVPNLPPCGGTDVAAWNQCVGETQVMVGDSPRTYRGEFQKGVPHGRGVRFGPLHIKDKEGRSEPQKLADGKILEVRSVGYFQNGKLSGLALTTRSDGSGFAGEYEEERQVEGEQKYFAVITDGLFGPKKRVDWIYIGTFNREGKFAGQGIIYHVTGSELSRLFCGQFPEGYSEWQSKRFDRILGPMHREMATNCEVAFEQSSRRSPPPHVKAKAEAALIDPYITQQLVKAPDIVQAAAPPPAQVEAPAPTVVATVMPAAPVAMPASPPVAIATPAPASANATPPAAVGSAKKRALVIGNDSYKSVPVLVNAREDARAMADQFRSLGYEVTLGLDLSERAMKRMLRVFADQVQGGDEVVFFFAGHGVQLGPANYLLPVDIAGETEGQVRDESIPLQRVLDDFSERKARFTLAILDACRDNPFKSTGRSIGGRGLAATTAATGQMVIFSAGVGQQALDRVGPADKSRNGLFTRVFLKEVQKPGLSVDRVVRNVRYEVVETARTIGHEQVPAIYDQVVGEFYFRR